ncbi:MAG TPA: c-type cytochrome biogenesis protein CcmI [Magnetospirillum sp.]|nr:c-type cytochrome biogenesis protein CcmI [Magnetospirillum sp.]
MIWIAFAALTAATVALLLVPLLRARPKALSRAAYDLTVYKDQLAEVDREVERGTLSADQAEAARTEIQRRILALGEVGKATAPSRASALAAGVAIMVVVPAIGFGMYNLLGQPQLPDQPYSARADKIAQVQDQAAMIKTMVAQLSARLEKEPNDGKGWAMLGRSLRVMGDTEKAQAAYKKAVAQLPGDTQVRMEYGALLLAGLPEGSMLPPEFVRLMREVVAVDPKNPDALYFSGLAEAQSGNPAKARDLWTRLLVLLPEGSEDRSEVQKQIDALK